MRVLPSQVLHIGDSLSSDVAGAYNLGIDSFWLNRKKRNAAYNCSATFVGNNLTDVIEVLK
jgi:2-haloacid dehalogenase/putative hydrolase of the HAD superfamily